MTMEVPTGVVLEVRVLTGARAAEQLLFFDAAQVKIGRNPACDVVLPDGAVSRQHAELQRVGDAYTLSDTGSTAGTFLLSTSSSERVTSATPLPPVAEVAFGSTGPRVRIGVGLSVPFGRYRLIGRLGGGGMAEVFMARQTGLGGFNRPVALKLIQPEMFALVDAGAMFLDEARIAAEISHHNVVKIYDVGDQDGVLYLAMEYLRGVTLSQMATQLQQRGERMPPDLVAALLSQACAGLHAAHTLRDASGKSLNVVHRDVSPSNLMCLPEGLVKVIDFGVARADTRLVRKEEGLQGKPAYMSPEQIQGQPLDGRSDVFAAGVVLYELCSGKPLFQRNDTVATFYAVVRSEVPPLSSVCPEATPLLDAVAKRALAKDPNLRYQSAAELAAELDQVVKEAGGRFSSIAAIARFLTDWGVSLVGPPPALLTQVPKARLTPRTKLPARVRKREPGDSDDSLESDETFNQAPEATLEPKRTGEAPSLSYEPERLIGKRIERYQVMRYLGRPVTSGRMQKRDRALPKLYYQAEAVSLGPGEQAARSAGLLEDNQVALLLCGQGASLRPFDEAQQARLAILCKQRRPPAGSEHLVAVLDCIHQPNGASVLVMPFVKRTLAGLLEAGPVRVEDALELSGALLRALASTVEKQADYVHGELAPSRVGLLPPSDTATGTRVVLLDLNLELALGMPSLPFQARATVQTADLPYLSPERWAGELPTAASDIYAVGAMLYQIFGGDLLRATTCLRARRELPRLPPQRGLLSHVESAVFLALRYEADKRPTAARLLELLSEGQGLAANTVRESAALLRIKPMPSTATKEPLRVRTPSGQDLLLTLLTVRAPKQHTTFALPLGKDVELLPAPLSLIANGETLLIEIDETQAAGSGSFDRSRNRPSLYHDAHEPSSRCDRYTLIPNAVASFDIGHRRTTVQRVNYLSTLRPGTAPSDSLLLPLPDLQIEVELQGPLLRGVVLYSVAPQTGTAHAVAIALVP